MSFQLANLIHNTTLNWCGGLSDSYDLLIGKARFTLDEIITNWKRYKKEQSYKTISMNEKSKQILSLDTSKTLAWNMADFYDLQHSNVRDDKQQMQ